MPTFLFVTTVSLLLSGLCAGFYGDSTAVVTLTPENFEEKVLKSDALWLVEFYAPWCGHCKQLAPNWAQAASALKGSVHFGAVDAAEFSQLGNKYDVQGFPTIKFFGDDKSKPQNYEGGRTASDLVKTALKLAKTEALARVGLKDDVKQDENVKKNEQKKEGSGGGFYEGTAVVELTDDTFESDVLNPESKGGWLVEFYAPWCGHCKNLAPAWKSAASQLAGMIHVAAVDATTNRKVADKYEVKGFPTIKFFPPGGAPPEEYNAGRSAGDIVEYGMKKAELYPMTPLMVPQIANQTALDELCRSKTLCVIFIVPHVMDTTAAGRKKLIDMFSSIALKNRPRGVAAGWIVGGDHTPFEEGYGIFSTYPTFIAIGHRNEETVYVTYKGAFTDEHIASHIKRILDGKVGVSIAKKEPKLTDGVPLWDGQDYVAPPEDEL